MTPEKYIKVIYLPDTKLEPEVYPDHKYSLSKAGEAPTYRVYQGEKTFLIPVGIVHKIETVL